MVQFEVLVTIGRRRSDDRPYPVSLRVGDLPVLGTSMLFDLSAALRAATAEDVGLILSSALFDPTSRQAIAAGLDRTRGWAGRRLTLRIAPAELFPLPWELILRHPPFAAHPDILLIRQRSQLDPMAAVPPTLPLDVFVATGADPEGRELAHDLSESVWKYFRCSQTDAVQAADLRAELRRRPLDIVHLIATPHRLDMSPRDLYGLNSALRQGNARLLVLQAEPQSYGKALDLGHRLLAGGGPATMVVSSERGRREIEPFVTDVYYSIVHDRPLDEGLSSASRPDVQAALLAKIGSEDVLRISPVADRLSVAAGEQIADAETARELISRQLGVARESRRPSAVIRVLEDHKASLESAAAEIRGAQKELDFRRETGGMVPLTEMTKTLARAAETLARAAPHTQRVVNTWFLAQSGPVAPEQSLRAKGRYRLAVQIGRPSTRSNVKKPHSIPEEELERFYFEDGLVLRVVLFSRDFELEETERTLKLAPPPAETEELLFPVVAPARTGLARLRACVYYENNLLQAVLVTARITPEPRRRLKLGNRGEVEFALAASIIHPERLPPRTLNILTNDRGDGTHTFAVVGTNLKKQLDFDGGELKTAVDEARKQMQQTCSDLDKEGRPVRYKFDRENRGREEQLVQGLRDLAAAGSVLYETILDRDSEFETRFSDLLRRPARVQVAATKSAKYVFPWALVYDKPLVRNGNPVCGEVLRALKAGRTSGVLEGLRCFNGDCPDQGRSDVICPSVFWGFKHVFEQPLSVATSGGGEMPLEIRASGAASLVMAVSDRLTDLKEHEQELKALPLLRFDRRRSSKPEIGTELGRQDLQVVYFYCHGGRTTREPYLGVGQKERIFPTELRGWKVRWTTCRPLVFINGCHTADLTPTDLVSFNASFSRCRAAGVIGTEISVPETLARYVARSFFEQLVARKKVGEIIRQARLALLERYNPLGLVYTPYCSADLQVVFS